jgi:hypothetical protein
MSPAATMDNSMPSSSNSLFNIPQLAEDGSNWVTYKHRMTIVLGARGLGEYVDGTVVRPILITTATSRTGITATTEEVKENRREVAEYTQKDYLVQQCKGTSVRFLTSPVLSHSTLVHMYSPSPPLYYLQGSYLKPTTSRPECPTTFQKLTHCQGTPAAYPPVTGQGRLNGCGLAKAG